jgi:predicted PolB exonuclease-like 3'-5' exonuclease
LAGFQPRANAPLDEMATLMGFPGKMGMSGAKVWENYLEGNIQGIRDYCETDVLNTYLVYLRFQLMRGRLNQAQYEAECQIVRDTLTTEDKPHFTSFLQAWKP